MFSRLWHRSCNAWCLAAIHEQFCEHFGIPITNIIGGILIPARKVTRRKDTITKSVLNGMVMKRYNTYCVRRKIEERWALAKER